MIVGHFGLPVEMVRLGTLDDVRRLDRRRPDKMDRDALRLDSYVVTRDCEGGKERLYHIGSLRGTEDGEVMREWARVRRG